MIGKLTWGPTWDAMDNISLCQAHLKKVNKTQNWRFQISQTLPYYNPHEYDGNVIENSHVCHFTLDLKACDHTYFNSRFSTTQPLYEFKGPHSFIVNALGHSVEWPLMLVRSNLDRDYLLCFLDEVVLIGSLLICAWFSCGLYWMKIRYCLCLLAILSSNVKNSQGIRIFMETSNLWGKHPQSFT